MSEAGGNNEGRDPVRRDPVLRDPVWRDPVWRDPVEGFEFEPDTVVVTEEHQAEKLRCCGIDPAVFAGHVDPSFYIGLGIQAGIKNGISAQGNVNMLQTLVQVRPVALGEPLTVQGRIDAITAVPRGITVATNVEFVDEAGRCVIDASRTSLKPDPRKAGQRGAGDRPPPVVADPASLEVLSSHRLTPDRVRGYSSEGNSIHYDMEAANEAGFRAPLIGGGMGVHFLMAALWRESPPQSAHFDIFFRRPIFWDDGFDVRMNEDRTALCLSKDGKVLTEARRHPAP